MQIYFIIINLVLYFCDCCKQNNASYSIQV